MSAPLWTREDVIAATAGKAEGGAWTASGVSIDSRTLEPGDLFVAILGENSDGHKYVEGALKRGAAAAIVSAPDDAMRAAGQQYGVRVHAHQAHEGAQHGHRQHEERAGKGRAAQPAAAVLEGIGHARIVA